MKCPFWFFGFSSIEPAVAVGMWESGELCQSRLAVGTEQAARDPGGPEEIVHEHLDQKFSITFGPHLVGLYTADAQPAVEMTPPRKATKRVASHRGMEKSRQKAA